MGFPLNYVLQFPSGNTLPSSHKFFCYKRKPLPLGKYKMARRRTRTRTRYRTRVKRVYSRSKGFLSSKWGNHLLHLGLGYGKNYIPQFIGKWTNPAVFYAAGVITKKPALQNLAMYELGQQLATSGMSIGNNGFFQS